MLRSLLVLLPSLLLASCATLTADSDQPITVTTEPAGASCDLRNDAGSWSIDETPGTARVERDFSPLRITCETGQGANWRAAATNLDAKTRGRAYGNILLLGVPALVDAKTGDGYEYDPAEAHLELLPEDRD